MNNEQSSRQVDTSRIKQMLKQKKSMKTFLSVCASCAFCADSCFLYRNHHDPKYMPSYKALNSLGKLFKRKGNVSIDTLEEMKDLLWDKCVLCRRCYCPMGIDISSMIAWARAICRTQGVYENYDVNARG